MIPAWSLSLLRCPCCMSEMIAGEGVSARVLRCPACGRAYPLQERGSRRIPIPQLKRDDNLATLAQDIVVDRNDPDSTRADRRRFIRRAERRERFLSGLLRRVPEPYAILAAGPPRPMPAPHPGEAALFERFVGSMPAEGVVLDLACGEGIWTTRLAGRGLHILGMDTSGPGLGRAADTVTGLAARATLVEADMMELPLAAASLDGVWCSETFEYVRPDRRAVFFRQVNRVLRHGGLLYLSAETTTSSAIVRQYVLWRAVFRQPVMFWEYICRLPPAHGGGWHYHVMTGARTLRALCRDHGFTVLSLTREGSLWLLLARKARGT